MVEIPTPVVKPLYAHCVVVGSAHGCQHRLVRGEGVVKKHRSINDLKLSETNQMCRLHSRSVLASHGHAISGCICSPIFTSYFDCSLVTVAFIPDGNALGDTTSSSPAICQLVNAL